MSVNGGRTERDQQGRFAPRTASGAATRFQPGNQAARRHGVRAFEVRGSDSLPVDLRVSVEDFKAQVIADRGGLDALSAIEKGYVVRLSEVETVSRLLAADLAAHGLFTAKRRVRSTLVRWLEVIDRWDRLAQRIGRDRRARPVVSFAEAVRAAQGDER